LSKFIFIFVKLNKLLVIQVLFIYHFQYFFIYQLNACYLFSNTFAFLQFIDRRRKLKNKVGLYENEQVQYFGRIDTKRERERNTKDLSSERTFQAIQNELFIFSSFF
jgi:hypothetical protein